MRILYDHQIFTQQTHGGISRYFCELIKNSSGYSDYEAEVALRRSNNEYIHDLLKNDIKYLFSNRNIRGKAKILNHINKKFSLQALKQGNYDVFHPTYFDDYHLDYLDHKPLVITIYDTIDEIFQDNSPFQNQLIRIKKKLAKRADKILTISESSKNDIIQFTGVEPDKVVVSYLGCSTHNAADQLRIDTVLPDKYILYVGNRTRYKNFQGFITETAKILSQKKDLYVVCAGGGSFSESEKAILHELKVYSKVIQFPVNDAELYFLYENAEVFVFPTLYEGFGIPVLESFHCRCPAVISNVSSLPEVGGDGAMYFNPDEKGTLETALNEVLSSESLKKDLVKKGTEQLRQFSWKKNAEETIALYRSVCR